MMNKLKVVDSKTKNNIILFIYQLKLEKLLISISLEMVF